MERFDRNAPLPEEMQGRWVDRAQQVSELVITPDGDFHACKVKFASQLARAPAQDS